MNIRFLRSKYINFNLNIYMHDVFVCFRNIGRPMIHPQSQTMTTNEGDKLDVTVEFCAEPSYTKILWMSEERVYTPGGELKDGVRALLIEVSILCTWFSYFNVLYIAIALLFEKYFETITLIFCV